jgi:hypothetical protein
VDWNKGEKKRDAKGNFYNLMTSTIENSFKKGESCAKSQPKFIGISYRSEIEIMLNAQDSDDDG